MLLIEWVPLLESRLDSDGEVVLEVLSAIYCENEAGLATLKDSYLLPIISQLFKNKKDPKWMKFLKVNSFLFSLGFH
jgi:hypothetical protein